MNGGDAEASESLARGNKARRGYNPVTWNEKTIKVNISKVHTMKFISHTTSHKSGEMQPAATTHESTNKEVLSKTI